MPLPDEEKPAHIHLAFTPRIASKSKLSIARRWRRVVKTMVHLVCARNTTRTTMQLSSLVRTGTTSKWFATNPRPDHAMQQTAAGECAGFRMIKTVSAKATLAFDGGHLSPSR